MQPTEEFTGLGMPVFTAFGWAGEETAQNYAYSQLEQFIALLHTALSAGLKSNLPYYGLSTEDRNVYLAAAENIEEDVHISFNVRPLSLEIQLALSDGDALTRALKQINSSPQVFLHLLYKLDPDWEFRIQQVQVDEETGDKGHYQDIYKGPVSGLNDENITELVEKAAYLNGDGKWETPIYLSSRISADQASAMQGSIIPVMSQRIELLTPIVTILQGRAPKKAAEAKAAAQGTAAPKSKPPVPAQVLEQPERPLSKEEFTFASELKPLHIQRGFINMTPEYWPFFAVNARTESRPVTVVAADVRDEESAVWRLQPTDMARLVLGPKAQRWLAANFVPGDYIQLVATRVDPDEIHIVLEPIS